MRSVLEGMAVLAKSVFIPALRVHGVTRVRRAFVPGLHAPPDSGKVAVHKRNYENRGAILTLRQCFERALLTTRAY